MADSKTGKSRKPPAHHPTTRRRGGTLLAKFLAIGFTLVFAAHFLRLLIRTEGEPSWSTGFWLALLGPLAFYFYKVWNEGTSALQERRKAIPAKAKLATDKRPPFLYLRSFRQDAKAQRSLSGSSDHEIKMINLFEQFGPVIAIGHPGDELVPLGAARLYVRGKNWQKEVARLMQESQLVVIQIDATEGLLWEIRTAIENLPPEQLLLLMPAKQRQEVYETFRAVVSDFFPRPLPQAADQAVAIAFGPKWGPLVIKGITGWKRLKAYEPETELQAFLDKRMQHIAVKPSDEKAEDQQP